MCKIKFGPTRLHGRPAHPTKVNLYLRSVSPDLQPDMFQAKKNPTPEHKILFCSLQQNPNLLCLLLHSLTALSLSHCSPSPSLYWCFGQLGRGPNPRIVVVVISYFSDRSLSLDADLLLSHSFSYCLSSNSIALSLRLVSFDFSSLLFLIAA